jgi:hypothetical protein
MQSASCRWVLVGTGGCWPPCVSLRLAACLDGWLVTALRRAGLSDGPAACQQRTNHTAAAPLLTFCCAMPCLLPPPAAFCRPLHECCGDCCLGGVDLWRRRLWRRQRAACCEWRQLVPGSAPGGGSPCSGAWMG